MNKKIAKLIRNPDCSECRLCVQAEDVCVTVSGPIDAEVLVVGKMPNSPTYQRSLENDLAEAGIDPSTVAFSSAVKCRNFEVDASRGNVKACTPYLDAEIELIKPKWILSMGNEALQATTGHSGVMKYRGKSIKKGNATIIPTISPLAVNRNPGQRQSYIADLNYFSARIEGKGARIKAPKIWYVTSIVEVKKLKKRLRQASALSFDVETWSPNHVGEHHPDAQIVSLSGTMQIKDKLVVWALPLAHPQSPFRKRWQEVLAYLAPTLEGIPRQIAHNGKYDCRWMTQFGVVMHLTFDTMLAVHLLNENLLKSLKFQAQNRFGVTPWAMDTKDLRQEPIMQVLEYNALDTYYTWHLYVDTKKQMMEQPRLARVLKLILMPASDSLVETERRGIWVDRERLHTRYKIALDMRAQIDAQLMEFVPPVETDGWRQTAKGKPAEVNFNPSNFLRWWLFDYLDFPIIKRGKAKEDGSPGDPSVAEDVMLELRMNHPHPVVDLLMERSKWQKYCSAFLSAYDELLDENDRIHTTFKLYGTVTGRLSSGKEDSDKLTSRAPVRGVNLQQVPRDDFIRGLFGSAPGYTFVEADFSQVELRVVAFLSRDKTMIHLYQTGQDIHLATAAWIMGKPAGQVTKDDRKKAKAVNFGFVYGMGWRKFIHTAFTKYDLVFSEVEAQGIRKAFFDLYTGLLPWHARQRRLVQQNRRVQSPLGRVRHLPDIDSAEHYVRAEAERQAINSPVQSFASDMTMLSMVLLEEEFERHKIEGHFISTVHDALLFEIRHHDVARALPLIKNMMENLPLRRKFGVNLDIPIIADLKVGKYWGDAKELTTEEVYNYAPS